jgi:hypothetical protein
MLTILIFIGPAMFIVIQYCFRNQIVRLFSY